MGGQHASSVRAPGRGEWAWILLTSRLPVSRQWRRATDHLHMRNRNEPGAVDTASAFDIDTIKEQARRAIAGAGARPKWFLFNAESTLLVDITGAEVLEELRAELAGQGITFAIARAKGFFHQVIERSGLVKRIGVEHVFPSVEAGAHAFLQGKG